MDLIVKARNGDLAAFEELYRLTSGFVYNVAFRIAARHAEAEDITQEVFIKVYAGLAKFEFRSSFKTWLYRITSNLAISHCRQSSRENEVLSKYREHREVEEEQGVAAGGTFAGENEEIVRSLLTRLVEDQRACVVLRDIEGLSYEEIAAVLNIPVNTVRSRLSRARETLARSAGKAVTP